MELADFLKWTPAKLTPIVSDGIFYEGSKAIIYGRYKSLKSMLALRFCLAVSSGDNWLGFDTARSSVMYLQYEIVGPLLQDRVKKMLKTGTSLPKDPLWFWNISSLKIDEHEGYKELDRMLGIIRPRVLVIDPIYKLVSGDLLSTNHIQKLVDLIDMLMEKHKLSVLMVHHTRKGASQESWGSDDMLGSTIFSAWADSVIEIERLSDKQAVVRFKAIRHTQTELGDRHFDVDLDTINFIKSARLI